MFYFILRVLADNMESGDMSYDSYVTGVIRIADLHDRHCDVFMNYNLLNTFF